VESENAEQEKKKLQAISLFSGAGGMDIGVRKAGFDILAEIEFDIFTFDYGTLDLKEVKTGIFTYTNVGNKPLVLFDVVVSCDCTEVEWQKEPVMPGKTGTIKAVYTAKTAGVIAKQITVQSNAQTDRVRLQLKGNVKE
jgi:hypothetical protein